VADKTPVTLEEIPINFKQIDGTLINLTLETSYTPEKNDSGVVTKITSGSFVMKNSAGDELASYDGPSDKFISVTSNASTDLIQQISNYQNGKSSPSLTAVVRVASAQIASDSNIKIGDERNNSMRVNSNFAADQVVKDADSVLASAATSIDIEAKTIRKEYGDYAYPENIRTNKQDRIRFTMRAHEGTNISFRLRGFGSGENFSRRSTSKGKITGSVTLPMQPGITDANSVDWNPGQLNSIQAFGAGASLSLMNSGNIRNLFTRGGQILQDVAAQVTEDNSINNALKVYLAQQAVGVQGLLSRTTGAVLNPNMELLFNAPALRPFTFNFVLSPRSDTEAKQVKQIIRFFKQGMSVKTTSSIFLKAPNIFDIRYQTFDKEGNTIEDHPSLNRIKTCALTGFNVDYTPSGSYMTFNDDARTMTQYVVQMNFTELDPIYEDDYHDGGDGITGSKGFREDLKGDQQKLEEIGF